MIMTLLSFSRLTPQTRGIMLMLMGMLLFTINDTLGKYMVALYSVGMLMLVRSIGGLIMLAPFIARDTHRQTVRRSLTPAVLGRSVLSVGESVLFYWAVVYLPVADVVTLYMAVPIFTTALAALLLGEQVGWRRWSAIALGFVGVVVALDPTADVVSPGAMIALVGSVCFAFLMIVTRRMKNETNLTLITGQTLVGIIFGAITIPLVLLFPNATVLPRIVGWQPAPWPHIALLLSLGVVATIAHMMVTKSLMLAAASVVVPFQYTTILWAVLFGYIVFGTVPQANMIVGVMIIIGAGAYIFFREQTLRRRNALSGQ